MPLVRPLVLGAFLALSCQPSSMGCGARPPPPVKLSADGEVGALLIAFEKSGLSLERNGETLDNAKATKWLRTKLSNRQADVRNAEDFILRVADHSTETKEPYQVVLADGTKVKSADWFRARLQELRP